MTEKVKAFELIIKFREADLEGMIFTADVNPEGEERHLKKAKRLALVAVYEILNCVPFLEDFWDKNSTEYSEKYSQDYAEYWEKVQEEIENYEMV